MPAVCRGDSVDKDVIHCSTPKRDQRSGNVFCNGTGISRQGDKNTLHLIPGAPCPSHAKPISKGSSTVFVNNKGCGRVGDGVTSCTSVATGSSNVFAGG
jgi:uncharacterized Zn-binding protein involved in type VI secretion